MANGVKSLRKIQIGEETTAAGTAIDATTIWRGQGSMQDDRETVFVEEDIGIFSGADRTHVPKLAGSVAFDDTPATFEQLGYILNAGIKDVAGVADSPASGFVYTHALPTTAANVVKTYTMEFGDNAGEEEAYYGFVQDFTLSGAGGEALTMSANWMTRQVAPGTFTAALGIPTIEDILFSKGRIFIDPVTTYPATTQVSATLLAATVNYTSGIIPKYTADNSLDFNFIQYTRPEITLDVTFEHNASAIAEKAIWRAETPRAIQLLFEGSAVETAGGTYANKSLIIDLLGKWETFDALGDQDGNDIVTGTFRALYNATAGALGAFTIVNELTALP